MNGKPTDGIQAVIETLKALIAQEAGEPDSELEMSARTQDLAKVFGGELAKAIAPVMEKVDAFRKDFDTLRADVDVIKGTKVSPRPKGSIAVDKVFDAGLGVGAKDAVAKRHELESISKEIDEFADTMKAEMSVDPSKRAEFERKGVELHKRYRECQRELNDILAGGQ